MRRFATPLLLAALVGLLGSPTLAQTGTGQTISTSTLTTRVFDNGSVQGDCASAPLFQFNGTEVGCGAGFMLGLSSTNVIGRAYNRAGAPSGWTAGTIGASTAFPYPTLTSGVKTTFSSAANNVSVEANHYYSEANPDYIVHQYKITNTGSAALSNVYPGFYVDYDVAGASAAANLAGYDAATQTLYTYFNASNPYVGVTALTGTVSGYKYFVNYPAAPATEETSDELYTALTTTEGPAGPANDIRGPLGVGPLSIPAGGTVTVAFASVAGTNQADLLANAADARSLTTGPLPVTSTAVATGSVTTTLYNNGNIGGDCSGALPAFRFGTDEGLCGAGFLLGISASEVVGDAYILDTTTEWTPTSAWTPSTVFPIAGLDQGMRTSYRNDANNVSVELNAYYATATPDFVVFRFRITNTGSAPLANVYPGIFADWDVGGTPAYQTNLAAVDPATQTLRVWDPTGASGNYFGVSALSSELSGWSYFIDYPAAAGQPQDEGQMYAGLTTEGPLDDPASNSDQRIVQGTGPFTIPAGGSVVADFAFVAGAGLADFNANVATVRGLIVAGEEGPGTGAAANALSAPRPNPTAGTAELSLTVEQSQTVRVAVYDALGREVAVLLDAPVAAGVEQALRVDARPLPAGVYVVRAAGETFQAMQRVIVTR